MGAHINNIVDSYIGRPISSNSMTKDSRFLVKEEFYSKRAIRSGIGSRPKVTIDFDMTPYGIVLEYERNKENLEIALMGFQVENNTINCVQLQGVKGKFPELTPILWSRELLSSGVEIAKDSSYIDEITIIPAHAIEGCAYGAASRLEKRYNGTAKSLGFEWVNERGLFVKKI